MEHSILSFCSFFILYDPFKMQVRSHHSSAQNSHTYLSFFLMVKAKVLPVASNALCNFRHHHPASISTSLTSSPTFLSKNFQLQPHLHLCWAADTPGVLPRQVLCIQAFLLSGILPLNSHMLRTLPPSNFYSYIVFSAMPVLTPSIFFNNFFEV